MWWDVKLRMFRSHPDCRCGATPTGHPCYCRGLRPLDIDGTPIGPHIVDVLQVSDVSETPEIRTDTIA